MYPTHNLASAFSERIKTNSVLQNLYHIVIAGVTDVKRIKRENGEKIYDANPHL